MSVAGNTTFSPGERVVCYECAFPTTLSVAVGSSAIQPMRRIGYVLCKVFPGALLMHVIAVHAVSYFYAIF